MESSLRWRYQSTSGGTRASSRVVTTLSERRRGLPAESSRGIKNLQRLDDSPLPFLGGYTTLSSPLGRHTGNHRMVSSMFLRHTGHARTVDAHCQHINECPHGFSTVCVGRSMHTLHSRVSTPAPRPPPPPAPYPPGPVALRLAPYLPPGPPKAPQLQSSGPQRSSQLRGRRSSVPRKRTVVLHLAPGPPKSHGR